ncbi:diaminopimelate epimerase [Xylanibacter ruminicola]|uniref:Diaminopimelate epimerase n=1 Tax=Xylanibacter ruminicola TaxID=839 RepID=A0A1M6UP21_XYLRU|nr:diaminopimelate epimerase [Xylanibacter ruminicola]SHK70937.1 diaminopimelate epimerase [Xylanibacter ruminicola]
MTKIRFTKMHGAGNDYIYVNAMQYPIDDPAKASILWSDRHKGIGSDGLVLIDKSPVPEADFSMRIFNADGSEAMMCGNASRCIGKYLYERGLTDKTEIRLLTLSGVKILNLHVSEGCVDSVTVDMLEPKLEDETQFLVHHGMDKGTFVSMGNPHYVIFTDNVDQVGETGRILEHHPAFPQRCNIEFATPLSSPEGDTKASPRGGMEGVSIRTRVWERGSGITQACGTGACATAVAAALTGKAGRTSQIVMDGGTLTIEWRESDNHVYMTGPAEFVFDGEIFY